MDDLLSFAHWGTDASVARTSIVRDVVYASSDPNRLTDTFFSIRWGVLLEVVRLPVSQWPDNALQMQTKWQQVRTTVRGEAADPLQGKAAQASVTQRRTRFDESSSSSSSDEEPVRSSPSLLPHRAKGTDANPLRPSAGSRYAHEFHVNTQRREIRKDIDRLFWDLPVLRDNTESKSDIEQLILCYCVSHKRDYRQGLHELAAFFYCTCMTDYERAATLAASFPVSLADTAIQGILDAVLAALGTRDAALALAFSLFEKLLGVGGLCLESWFYTTSTDESTAKAGGIVAASQKVQCELLAALDPPLAHQLNDVYEIQSPTYLIRWLRLVFLREFSLSQSLLVWTVIFADFSARSVAADGTVSPVVYALEDSIIMFIAVAMLERIADALQSDADTALRALMKYPPQSDVLTLLRHAATLTPTPALAHDLAPPAPPRAPQELPPKPPTVAERQGEALASVIQFLEPYWFPPETMSAEERHAVDVKYMEAIARLKKVRDVLLYGVDE